MRIGELAAMVGLSARAVRHYHRRGLLPEPARRPNGYRDYGLRDAIVLARIRRLTELGLSLDEVRDALTDDRGRDLHEILVELDGDLARQEARIRDRRARLAVLIERAEGGRLHPDDAVSPDGRYRFTGLAPGQTYDVLSEDRDRSHGQSWSPNREDGSRFSWLTGEARIAVGDQNADSGFVTPSMDYMATDIQISGPEKERYDVGDEIDVMGTVMLTGNTTARLAARMTLPEGVRVKRALGDFDVFGDPEEGDALGGWTTNRVEPGVIRKVGATIVVEKPINAGLITFREEAELRLDGRGHRQRRRDPRVQRRRAPGHRTDDDRAHDDGRTGRGGPGHRQDRALGEHRRVRARAAGSGLRGAGVRRSGGVGRASPQELTAC